MARLSARLSTRSTEPAMTERKQMSVDIDTIRIADRCAAVLTFRGTLGKVTRIGAVRIARGELWDQLSETAAAAAVAGVLLTEPGEGEQGGDDG
jgi:hypothetical protein